jgi:cobalt/nickel transport system ATP-binding protein
VFYDDALLDEANLHPPTPARLARRMGLGASVRPVTESELVASLADASTHRADVAGTTPFE